MVAEGPAVFDPPVTPMTPPPFSTAVYMAALANPTIPFRVGSFEAIPAGEGAFDAVIGNFVFNHVGRPEAARE